MIRRLASTAALAVALLATPTAAQDFAVMNATLATGDGSDPVPDGTVIVRGGQVVYAGPTAGAASLPADVIDGQGLWVTPGLFAAGSTLGLLDVDGVEDSNDLSANRSPFSAAIDVSVAVNPSSEHLKVSRAGGVTRAAITGFPASTIFGGQGAIIDLGADPQAVMRPRAFQIVNLGERGARLAGGSRPSAHALFRNALREAGQYGDDSRIVGGASRIERERTGDDLPLDPRVLDNETERGSDTLLTRFDAAALVPVVRGLQPLWVQVERAADIRSVLALKSEFPDLDLVLVGASEGWLVASEIAAAGVPVVADPLNDLPSSFEQLAATQSNVGRMVDAGVTVAIGNLTDGIEQPRNATQYAGNLVALSKLPGASGLTWGEAFAAITSVPARVSGYGGRLGVLANGARGDIVLWDGDPLELDSVPVRVFIDGVDQPMVSHQSRLRDRYRVIDDDDRPKAYDW